MKRLLIALALIFVASHAQAIDMESTLTRTISERIEKLGNLGRYELTIEERSGAVILTGSVESQRAKDLISLAASQAEGVRSIDNQLEVRLPSGESQLVKRVREAVGQRDWALEISLKDQVLTLEGEAPSLAEQKDVQTLAEKAAEGQALKLLVTVKNEPFDNVVHARVQESLRKENYPLPASVSFRVRDGIVYFEGTVANHRIIDDLLSHTLMVEGVKDVKSQVRILTE